MAMSVRRCRGWLVGAILLALGATSCSRHGPARTEEREPGRSAPPPAPPRLAAPVAGHADLVVVEKAARRMMLLHGGDTLRAYTIALGRQPVGDKVQAGDGRTPEGRYRIDRHVSASRFHRSLHVSYPDAADRAQARALGVQAGGDIMIHGQPNHIKGPATARLRGDWTLGCIAVSNAEIDEIWKLVRDGTPIEIRP